MSKLFGNELAKLTASYLNGVSIALLAVGVLAPSASSSAEPPSLSERWCFWPSVVFC